MLGRHISIDTSLLETVTQTNWPVIQVYLPNERISPADQLAISQWCHQYHRKVYVHSHLHNNLAKKNATYSLRRLKQDLVNLGEIPGACVLHVGKACDYTTGKRATPSQNQIALDQIAVRLDSLASFLPNHQSPRLLLENAAGQGTEVGTSWDHFRHLIEATDVGSRLGLCFDTQHAFASGLVDMRSENSVNEIFDQATEVGWTINLIHLNDSKVPWNGRVDRHQSIGQGYIWHQSLDSLKVLLDNCQQAKVDVVLETPQPQQDLDWLVNFWQS